MAESFEETLRREQLAQDAMYRGDPEPFKALFSHSEDVSLFGAFGPCKKGWAEVTRTFDWVAGRYRDGTVRSQYEVIYQGGDLAYTVSYEHGSLLLDGQRRTHTIRVTQIYRREDDQWRLIHRHGDFAPTEQSPPSSRRAGLEAV